MVHRVAQDPGIHWIKDPVPAIEVPPDSEVVNGGVPDPAGVWPRDAKRSGLAGVVAPNVVLLGDGRFRMYYTQILPRPGFPAGATEYENSSARILSAVSTDGEHWIPDSGVRLSPQEGGAGDSRLASPEVVPIPGTSGHLRMYFECAPRTLADPCSIRSAVSKDDGLTWRVEPGDRLSDPNAAYAAPRLLYLEDGRCRMYVSMRPEGVVSAISEDGLLFEQESGYRIHRGDKFATVLAAEVLQIASGSYRMYYGAYPDMNGSNSPEELTRACILSAVSEDGLEWQLEPEATITPGGKHDAAKVSEMCVIAIPASDGLERYRMFYEAADGTAPRSRGVWRILAADAAL